MILSDRLLISDELADKTADILRSLLDDGPYERKPAWYLITTTPSDHTLMYILSNVELARGAYEKNNLKALGLAGSWRKAGKLVEQIFEEARVGKQLENMKEYLNDY